MDTQQPIDYFKMFAALVKRLGDLTRQRDVADVEIAKVKQLIVATFPLIPEEKQRMFQSEIDAMDEEATGLLDAVKLVLSQHKGEWLSVSHIRDYLIEMGFDFRHYRANPLASIATTLKRMIPNQVESMNSGSGMLYQRRKTIGDRIAEGYGQTVPPPPGADDVEESLHQMTHNVTADRIRRIKAVKDK
jgi:hypothetical protein